MCGQSCKALVGGGPLDVWRCILVCIVKVLGKSSTKVLLNMCIDRGKYTCHIYDVIVVMMFDGTSAHYG